VDCVEARVLIRGHLDGELELLADLEVERSPRRGAGVPARQAYDQCLHVAGCGRRNPSGENRADAWLQPRADNRRGDELLGGVGSESDGAKKFGEMFGAGA